ncbi:MAG: tyrosine-protein phosphatase [Planctomycetes bacterium]|nr:tyrosine-protein phosphatase [Planctomycetota bacterium]
MSRPRNVAYGPSFTNHRSAFALLLVLLALGGCRAIDAPLATSTASGKPFAKRLEGLENFAQIDEFLYRGSQPDAADFRELAGLGIKTVISLRSYRESDDVEAAGMTLVQIPMQADLFGSEPPTDEQVRLFFTTVLDPTKRPVFFHCERGKDRTGTMAALWRIERNGWTPDEAIEEMRAFGYHDYFEDLIEFVRNYEPRGFD